MKKRIISAILAVSMLLGGANVLAVDTAYEVSPRASLYLDSYSAGLTPKSNCKMSVAFFVFGTRDMDKIGVDKIVVQEWSGTKWLDILVVKGKDHPEFYAYNTANFGGSYTFTGFPGGQYQAVITVYAGLNGGYDTREITSPAANCSY